MSVDAVDLALEEFRALRAEIVSVAQTQAALLGLALTATGVIGAFALGKSGNRNALLALPFFLGGLAIVNTRYSLHIRTVGQYVRADLWRYLSGETQSSTAGGPVGWETWLAEVRRKRGPLTLKGSVDYVGQVIIFGVPSVGALVITGDRVSGPGLTTAWWFGVGVLLIAGTYVALIQLGIRRDDDSPGGADRTQPAGDQADGDTGGNVTR